MKNQHILSLAAALTFTISASAEVVVYKGSSRTTADFVTQQNYPKASSAYLVMDFTNHQIGLILFYAKGTGKRFYAGTPGTIHITSTTLPQGRTGTVISLGANSDLGPTNYSELISCLRGTDASVTVATNPTVVQKNLPRLLSGFTLNTGNNAAAGYYLNQSFVLSVDGKKTIEVNNGKQTLQQALDALGAELKAKGFKSL